jgi:uncharacterized membrane protein
MPNFIWKYPASVISNLYQLMSSALPSDSVTGVFTAIAFAVEDVLWSLAACAVTVGSAHASTAAIANTITDLKTFFILSLLLVFKVVTVPEQPLKIATILILVKHTKDFKDFFYNI